MPHNRSADPRSIGWRIDQAPVRRATSSTGDHILFLTSGTTPKSASPGQWWRHGHHHVVRRDCERYHLVDHHRDMAAPCSASTAGAGTLNLAELQRRHRASSRASLRPRPPPWSHADSRCWQRQDRRRSANPPRACSGCRLALATRTDSSASLVASVKIRSADERV
jgi:hypothetical protein